MSAVDNALHHMLFMLSVLIKLLFLNYTKPAY